MSDVLNDFKHRSQKALEKLEQNLTGIRTGRANVSLLDRVQVEAYGSTMHIRDVATISIGGPRQLVLEPFDRANVHAIEKGIMTSDLNLTPQSDGKCIRINLPPLTEDRRKELVKVVKKEGEEAKIAIRNIRRDANDTLKRQQKDGEIAEDQLNRQTKEIQNLTDKAIADVDRHLAEKEKDILEK